LGPRWDELLPWSREWSSDTVIHNGSGLRLKTTKLLSTHFSGERPPVKASLSVKDSSHFPFIIWSICAWELHTCSTNGRGRKQPQALEIICLVTLVEHLLPWKQTIDLCAESKGFGIKNKEEKRKVSENSQRKGWLSLVLSVCLHVFGHVKNSVCSVIWESRCYVNLCAPVEWCVSRLVRSNTFQRNLILKDHLAKKKEM